MYYVKILILAIVQGVAELLPVSSSAHVIVAEKFLGLDPSTPENVLLLLMLHTGTMLAVIWYFWQSWKVAYFSSVPAFIDICKKLVIATGITGIVGLGLQWVIKHFFVADPEHFEIEHLFGNLQLVAFGLAAAGIVIIGSSTIPDLKGRLTMGRAAVIGVVQGFCLPFRGFSRSGATISAGLMCGVGRVTAEEFSFALAVVLTPVLLAKEGLRFMHARSAEAAAGQAVSLGSLAPGLLLGMICAFGAGLLALRWLSSWLGNNRWHFFGFYCLTAAAFCFWLGS